MDFVRSCWSRSDLLVGEGDVDGFAFDNAVAREWGLRDYGSYGGEGLSGRGG
jgi:hypothetical protein